MAEDYASWIGRRFPGPVDVIGFSTGEVPSTSRPTTVSWFVGWS
jgi:hypothetical protein